MATAGNAAGSREGGSTVAIATHAAWHPPHSSIGPNYMNYHTPRPDRNEPPPNWPLVMVVEDDRLTSDTLEIALESREYRVLGPAASVRGARELLESSTPDIALIDARLATTESDGLLASLTTRHVPICVLTGLTADELPPVYAGCAVLRKPFGLNALLVMLHRIRPGRQAP
jgi:ActR/RegA family two-component response regulator